MKHFACILTILSLFFSSSSCGKTVKEPDPNQDVVENPDGTDDSQSQQDPPVVEDPDPVHSPDGCIENDVVYAYMQCGPYERFGAKSWFYDPVVKATANLYGWKGDDPKGIPVSWEGDAGEYTVSLSTPDGLWYEDTVSGNTYTFNNLIPGVAYTYRITAAGNPVKESSFTPTGQVRMLDIPFAWNYRDEGGWTGLEGKKVRYGWIYRGSSLNGQFLGKDGTLEVYDVANWVVPDTMRVIINRIGIKAELDLRGNLNVVGLSGDNKSAHSNSLEFSQFEDVDYFWNMSDYAYYHPLERSALVQDLAFIIAELKKGRPVAYHCRSGADRTGVLGGLLLGLLGVSDGDIARDYELTTLSSEYPDKRLKLASEALTAAPGNFSTKQGIRTLEGETVQEKYYRYVNQHFSDVHINAEDIDWYIKFMLGLDNYTHPSWAVNYEDNSLEKVISITDGSAQHVWP